VKTAFGLDLAGYSAGKSSLGKATFDDKSGFSVTIFRNHAFAKKLEGRDSIDAQAENERNLIRLCRPLYVDVPIDLQGLPTRTRVHFVWQLTKRPVDYAFSALSPLADRLGAPVARMAYLLGGDQATLGADLFETYPAASLIPMIRTVPSYKSQTAERQGGRWIGDDGLADILTRMRVDADEGVRLNDDHFDAAICAITGVLADHWLLYGEELESEIRRRLEGKVRSRDRAELVARPPNGYVLIRKQLSDLPLWFQFEHEFPLNTGVTE